MKLGPGAILWSTFPDAEKVVPGHKLRPALIINPNKLINGKRHVLAAYCTTSHTELDAAIRQRLPHCVLIPQPLALSIGLDKATLVDFSNQKLMPYTKSFFSAPPGRELLIGHLTGPLSVKMAAALDHGIRHIQLTQTPQRPFGPVISR